MYIYVCTYKRNITIMLCTNPTNMVEVEGTTDVHTSFNFPLTKAICHYLQTLFSYLNVSNRESHKYTAPDNRLYIYCSPALHKRAFFNFFVCIFVNIGIPRWTNPNQRCY